MRGLLLLLILLAFPVTELVLLFSLAERFGWSAVFGYLLLAVLAGWLLIMDERLVALGRVMQTLEQGRHPLLALFASAKKIIAGVLLIVPGVMSDVIAGVLLISMLGSRRRRQPPARDDVIEGEWRRED